MAYLDFYKHFIFFRSVKLTCAVGVEGGYHTVALKIEKVLKVALACKQTQVFFIVRLIVVPKTDQHAIKPLY